ncbi:DNA alkylation repair protein [Pseudonocardia sp. TRM90224]|uniref:DNA alkylation repair protein n=1 Tax=Pseudonocardia sp. TRM90224 TaxID=2812678 RepID=UPI001E61C79A|nr:DNA alkylation repair protein [Pseudonocardia sp. TRM90224]
MPFADELVGRGTIEALASCLHAADPGRRWDGVAASAAALSPLALGARVRLAADALVADCGEGFAAVAAVVRAALPDPSFTGWMIWPVTEAVATAAVVEAAADDGPAFDDGLALLAELTPRLTAEFALRTFLNADLDRTLAVVEKWVAHPDEHVRRLASEGTRTRLPWARQVPELNRRPDATLPILEALYADPAEYVRRSVANHLNDLSRLDPALAVAVADGWLARPAESTPRVVRHAMRTLVKKADPGALALLGFPPAPDVAVGAPQLVAGVVALGDELEFSVELVNNGAAEARLVVDYVVHYRKAAGSLAPKVFKLTSRTLAPGERVVLAKRHSFRPVTTRRHYPGEHAVEVQVNGARSGRVTFDVVGIEPAGQSRL